MSIKSRTPGVASDVPLNSKQREPAYTAKDAGNSGKPKLVKARVNNISDYVKSNLSKTVKPRGKENR